MKFNLKQITITGCLLLSVGLLGGCSSDDANTIVIAPDNQPIVTPAGKVLSLTPNSSLMLVGSPRTFELAAQTVKDNTPVGTTENATSKADWSSDDPSIAEFVSPGVFRGRSPGKTTVRASLDGAAAVAPVEVLPAPPPPPANP